MLKPPLRQSLVVFKLKKSLTHWVILLMRFRLFVVHQRLVQLLVLLQPLHQPHVVQHLLQVMLTLILHWQKLLLKRKWIMTILAVVLQAPVAMT
jgi:hypothetical protein